MLTVNRNPVGGALDSIGKRIAQARDAKRLSQPQLAKLVLPESGRVATVSAWETDKSQPDAKALGLLAQTLGVTADWLLFGAEAENGGGIPGASDAPPYDQEREERELKRAAESHDPLLRIMERDSIAAVIRAQALREVAWTNRMAEQLALVRATSIRGITSGRKDVVGPVTSEEVRKQIESGADPQPGLDRAAG